MKRDHHNHECSRCGSHDHWLLHNVSQRATYRRFCTNCLLKNNPALFCPFCFHVYDDSHSPPSHSHGRERVMCLKCPSVSHLSCVPSSHPHSPPSFICPACSSSSPNFSFFCLNSKTKPPRHSNPNHGRAGGGEIDKDSARALVAAAKIAAISMAKAAAAARLEAERRVKEASLAKKRAREALETLSYLAAKEKQIKDTGARGLAVEQHKFNNNSSKRIEANRAVANDQSTNGAVQGEKGSNGIHS